MSKTGFFEEGDVAILGAGSIAMASILTMALRKKRIYREPTAEELAEQAAREEREAWNREVESRKAAKRKNRGKA